jgi:hypothetical protein
MSPFFNCFFYLKTLDYLQMPKRDEEASGASGASAKATTGATAPAKATTGAASTVATGGEEEEEQEEEGEDVEKEKEEAKEEEEDPEQKMTQIQGLIRACMEEQKKKILGRKWPVLIVFWTTIGLVHKRKRRSQVT